ncbi:MAG TPA: hypothetical protein VFN42_13650 [Acetobacteraceae bacterium]|nr:hypothetical protein [Acetobacteraceae bacterium]
MPRPALLAALLLFATPALAQVRPSAPLGPSGQNVRSFSLKNMSHAPVVFARARMTDGKIRALTYSPIQPGEARQIVVPRKECLADVVVKLNNGRTLKAPNLNDCRSNQLVVRDRGINVLSADVRQLRRGKLPPSSG